MQGIKGDCRGIRHVEAFDLTRCIEPHHLIAGLARQLPETLALGAEDEGQGTREPGIADIHLRLAVEAQEQEAAAAQFLHGTGEVGDLGKGHMFIGAGGRFEEDARRLRTVPGGGDEGRHPESGAASHNGPDIMRVGHLVEEDDHPLDVAAWRRERGWTGLVIEAGIAPGRNLIHDGPTLTDTARWLRGELERAG